VYLKYTAQGEPPATFNRWSLIVAIGAYLGRQYYFEHGHSIIYPNMYAMLIGVSGTRKSTSIKLMKKLIQAAGYSTIAADRSTKEKFLLDLAGEDLVPSIDDSDILNQNLFPEAFAMSGIDREMFIMADEFNDFFGNGNIEFISLLGSLWDFNGEYKNRIKTGKSVVINNPTISILGGNTPTQFNVAFPPEVLGQGFFSRTLLIYGEPNGKRITFPPKPEQAATEFIVKYFAEIKRVVSGGAKLSRESEKLLDTIYQQNNRIDDVRFDSYSNRRLNHLIKLCLIVSASRFSIEITERDIIYANTILTHAEQFMPKALGQFGKAKNSDVTHKILEVISNAERPITITELWTHVSNDLEKITYLQDILTNLVAANKIQTVKESGFLPRKKVLEAQDDTVNFSLLTDEERGMKI
jgi:Protein of unknown function (DUF3987)